MAPQVFESEVRLYIENYSYTELRRVNIYVVKDGDRFESIYIKA